MENSLKTSNDILYVILNGSLNMSGGKASAQAVHAAMMLVNKHRENFTENYRRSVIVLEAKNYEQIMGIAGYLTEANIDYEYYVDEGKNEVDAFSTTALAVQPLGSEDDRRKIFEDMPLYGSSNETQENYDEDDCNTCGVETTEDATYRMLSGLCAEMRALRFSLIPKPPKLRWYQKLFRRNQGFVS